MKKRKLDSDKGDYGHVLILAGSLGLTGAAYLASQACLLSGSGLVTLGIPESLNSIMEIKLSEVMTKPLAETKQRSFSLKALAQIRMLLPRIDALGIGPGISRNPQTQKLVQQLLLTAHKPTVLDADGLTALAGHLNILLRRRSELVITPHAGEMARLLGLSVTKVKRSRVKIARDFAKRYKLVVVLKGYHTVVANPSGRAYINKSGNPGMASAGCGDVLTGMIASLLGQGQDSFSAAKSAVYLHGRAGDYAAKEKGEISLIASDLLGNLPRVFKKIS